MVDHTAACPLRHHTGKVDRIGISKMENPMGQDKNRLINEAKAEHVESN